MPKGVHQTKEHIQKRTKNRIGSHLSDSTKKKLSMALKGRKVWNKGKTEIYSKESLQKMSDSQKGITSWWKGKKRPEITGEKNCNFGKKMSEEQKQKIREKRVFQIFTPETRKKMGDSHRGEKNSMNNPIHRLKISGPNSYLWKGGITPENVKIRSSIEYEIWRNGVFAINGYTCQKTGQVGGKLVAHHILNFSSHPELRFAIDNGVTLSLNAHKEFHKKYGNRNNTKEQLIEFLNK